MERYIFIKKLRADGMHWGGYELYYKDDGIRSKELVFDGYGFDTIKQALEHIREEHVKFIEALKRRSSLVDDCRKKIAEFKSA